MGVAQDIVKPTVKSVNSSIIKLSIELVFGWKSEKYLIYAWILLLLISNLLAFIIQNWTLDIQPCGDIFANLRDARIKIFSKIV